MIILREKYWKINKMFHNLFFVISDELYNNIFVFLKKTVLLSDVHIQYLHAKFLLTLLYVTNITSRI